MHSKVRIQHHLQVILLRRQGLMQARVMLMRQLWRHRKHLPWIQIHWSATLIPVIIASLFYVFKFKNYLLVHPVATPARHPTAVAPARGANTVENARIAVAPQKKPVTVLHALSPADINSIWATFKTFILYFFINKSRLVYTGRHIGHRVYPSRLYPFLEHFIKR